MKGEGSATAPLQGGEDAVPGADTCAAICGQGAQGDPPLRLTRGEGRGQRESAVTGGRGCRSRCLAPCPSPPRALSRNPCPPRNFIPHEGLRDMNAGATGQRQARRCRPPPSPLPSGSPAGHRRTGAGGAHPPLRLTRRHARAAEIAPQPRPARPEGLNRLFIRPCQSRPAVQGGIPMTATGDGTPSGCIGRGVPMPGPCPIFCLQISSGGGSRSGPWGADSPPATPVTGR